MIQSRHGDRANGRTRVPGISGAAQSRNERKPSPVDSLTLSLLPSSTVTHSITITLYHPLHFDARDVSAHARDWPFCSPSRPRSLPHAAFPSLRAHRNVKQGSPARFKFAAFALPQLQRPRQLHHSLAPRHSTICHTPVDSPATALSGRSLILPPHDCRASASTHNTTTHTIAR